MQEVVLAVLGDDETEATFKPSRQYSGHLFLFPLIGVHSDLLVGVFNGEAAPVPEPDPGPGTRVAVAIIV
jgi:hypothetical protein